MSSSLEGRVAVVFGVANKRSIAWSIAQGLHRAGATLAITYQNQRLEMEAKDLILSLPGAEAYMCDVSDDAAIERLFGQLKERYGKLLKAPELSVTMRRFAPEIVYVDGWVARPGLIRSDVPLTVARALARAGGMKTGARTGGILILRHDADGTVHPYEVALGSYAGAAAEDPLLKSFDVVYVPQSPIAAVADFAQQYYGKVPFSASFTVSPTPAPTIIVPQVVAPPAPAPAPVAPR